MTSEDARGSPERPDLHRYKDEYSWLSYLGFAFLTYNSILAIYRSINDPWMVAFVVGSYVDLMSLFYFLRVFEKTSENSPQRGRLKVVVWTLATLLTLMFSYKVATIMPLAVKVIVWAMAGTTTLGGFYAFFIYKENSKPQRDCVPLR